MARYRGADARRACCITLNDTTLVQLNNFMKTASAVRLLQMSAPTTPCDAYGMHPHNYDELRALTGSEIQDRYALLNSAWLTSPAIARPYITHARKANCKIGNPTVNLSRVVEALILRGLTESQKDENASIKLGGSTRRNAAKIA